MQTVIALCSIGLESVLANELRKLGFSLTKTSRGKVLFDTDAEGIAKAHIHSRVPERFLLCVAQCKVRDFDDLFDAMKAVPWETWVRKTDRIVMDKVRLSNASLKSVPNTQSIALKAAYERLCATYKMTRMGETGREVNVRIYVDGEYCQAGIDLSGDPLHLRGYRKMSGPAPMRETVAAGIILLSGWKRKFPLYDPFCGTGTIPIEAGLYAWNRAPGLERAFAYEAFPVFSGSFSERLRREARESEAKDCLVRISGSDTDKQALEAAAVNAEAAGMTGKLSFFKRTMEEARKEFDEGYMIVNPPYGERLHDKEWAKELYRRMRHIKKNFTGWKLGVVTTDKDFPVEFDLEPERTVNIKSGNEDLFFNFFSL